MFLHNVFSPKYERPYFEIWLRRTGRQLAASGRLSQVAVVLANEQGGTPDEWRTRLRILLEGNETPSIELLTRIDALLAGPSKSGDTPPEQKMLF